MIVNKIMSTTINVTDYRLTVHRYAPNGILDRYEVSIDHLGIEASGIIAVSENGKYNLISLEFDVPVGLQYMYYFSWGLVNLGQKFLMDGVQYFKTQKT